MSPEPAEQPTLSDGTVTLRAWREDDVARAVEGHDDRIGYRHRLIPARDAPEKVVAETAWPGTRTMSSIEGGVETGGSNGGWMEPHWRSLEGYRLILGLTGRVTAVGFGLAC